MTHNLTNILYFHHSSTTLACARALKEKQTELMVMTNGLNIAIELTKVPHLTLICTGGTANGDYFTFNGPVAKRAIKSHYFDIAVIGVGGVSSESGLTVSSYLNAEVLEAMIQNSQWIIVLVDHRKLGSTRFAHLVDLDKVNVIVTDKPIEPKMMKQFEELDIEIVVAQE